MSKYLYVFLVGLVSVPTYSEPLVESPHPRICGMIGASFDDSDNLGYKAPPWFMDYFSEMDLETTIRITYETRLLTPLMALGQRGISGWFSHEDTILYKSAAYGGAQTYAYAEQISALDRRQYLKGYDCLIVGLSGSFMNHPEESLQDLRDVYNWARAYLPETILIYIIYPELLPGINISWGAYFESGVNWERYNHISRQEFVRALCHRENVVCVDAWNGMQGGRDGFHPNMISVRIAAERMDRTIRSALGMLPIEY